MVSAPETSQTGIKILIVGGGFGGLSAAIESKLRGHDVLVLEKFQELKILGDIISFGPNSGRIFERWGLEDKMWPICTHLDFFNLHTSKGDLIVKQALPDRMYGSRSYNGHRGELHKILWDHAVSLGVEIRTGSDVTEYWETETESGVVCNGERISADVTVAADGVRSSARKLVLGYEDKPKPSGYAVYRAWFNAAEQGVSEDPLSACLTEGGHDNFYGWVGGDVHMLCSSSKGGKDVSWVITHKDEADIEEGWQFPGKMEDVLAIVKDWDPRCAAILSKAPSCVDWKLVYRDPLATWVSKKARVLLIGDAAHPFLPTSAQGASQAVEDGVTLAIVLLQAGKKDIPLAIRAFEKIRYDRVRYAQLTGEKNRDVWHKTESEKAKANPEKMAIPRDDFVLGHDSEKHAFKVYADVAADIKKNGYKLPVLSEDLKRYIPEAEREAAAAAAATA